MTYDEIAIETLRLRKVYTAPAGPAARAGAGPRPQPTATPASMPSGVVALQGLDLEIRRGELFGLLGPNGAGKTTTVSLLTTRLKPTDGAARVAGFDLIREPVRVRRHIGVAPQRPNPDTSLSVRENLVFHAAYFGISRADAERRADRLLQRMSLADRAGAKPQELSGGQQQRLMIARALIHDPAILFLDEPTMGLDPAARLLTWELMQELRAAGHTIVLTTHNMEEADRLCDRIAILDRGQRIALGTPAELKRSAPGGTLVELHLASPAESVAPLARALPGIERVEAANGTLRAYAARGAEAAAELLRSAEGAGHRVTALNIAPPSLETLFVSLTGRRFE
jgi:ABC-2 type transport system ATP-binding protein